MIPIASSTTLSLEKVTALVQNLLHLKKEKGVDVLPTHISSSIDKLLETQQTLVREIDEYLHQSDHFEDDDNMDMVSTIVRTCPEFLATNDKDGNLLCHLAASVTSSSAHKYLVLFADIGHRYNVGGEESRGGILLPATWCNVLEYISEPKVFHLLQKHNPPLFCKEDVQTYELLHHAAQCKTLDLVKYFCTLDPSCLYQLDEENLLPIHWAIERLNANNEDLIIVQYLLQQSVSYSVSNETIGGLFTVIQDKGDLFLDILIKKWGREEIWDCIEKALSTNHNLDKLPFLHQTIRYTPQYCSEVINRFPSSVYVRDDSNRLPIHVALDTGMKFSLELSYLITVSQEYLREVDPLTKWPPFVLAAMGTSCDLRTIYRLLHKHPEHVVIQCDGSRYRYIPLENCTKNGQIND